jgi:hypothetical protein
MDDTCLSKSASRPEQFAWHTATLHHVAALRSQPMQHARSDRVARACVVARLRALFGATACLCLHDACACVAFAAPNTGTSTPHCPPALHWSTELLFGHSSCSTLGPIALHAHVWWLGCVRFLVPPRVRPSLPQKQAPLLPTALLHCTAPPSCSSVTAHAARSVRSRCTRMCGGSGACAFWCHRVFVSSHTRTRVCGLRCPKHRHFYSPLLGAHCSPT